MTSIGGKEGVSDWGGRFQGREVMELSVSPGTFLGGGDPDPELSPSPRVPGMSACRALEEL